MAHQDDQQPGTSSISYKSIYVKTLLKEFTKYFIARFEIKLKEYNEEADIRGTQKEDELTNEIINPLAKAVNIITGFPIGVIQRAASLMNNHKEKATTVDDVLGELDKNDLRTILVVAAGDIFYSFQNQFINVTDADGSHKRAMHKLADDAVDRIMDYIGKCKKKNISIKGIDSNLITKGLIMGQSKMTSIDTIYHNSIFKVLPKLHTPKSGHSIKQTKQLNSEEAGLTTSTFYTRPTILKIGRDGNIQCFASIEKNDSENEFWYRFTFEWEPLKNYELLKNHKEITPEFIITKEELEENLKSILKSINIKDMDFTQQEIYKEICVNKSSKKKINSIWFEMMKPIETFTGRIDVLKKLYDALHQATGSAVISQTISGLGGIGKSELTKKYAYEYHKEYDNVIWINSKTYESLKGSFHRLAKRLSILTKENNEERTIASIIADIYTRFGLGKCLFIFDNAEDYKIIKEFLPLSLCRTIQRPHILLTSRSQNWELPDAKTMTVINLGYFTEEEAINYIKDALPTEESLNDEEIIKLVKALWYFPLALEQAVAYIKETNSRTKISGKGPFTISDYIKLYQDEKPKLLGYRHKHSSYTETILTTWNITLNKIEEENKNSIKIIEIMSYLVPGLINADRMFKELITDEEKRQDAIYLLLNYSMINIKDRVSSIHRLVQKVIRLQLKGKGKETDVLKKVLELLGFNLRTVDEIHLISVWSYACDYGEIIDQFFFKYESFGDKKLTPFHLIFESGNIDAVNKILNHLKKKSNNKFQEILNYKVNDYDETPLDISIRQNNLEMVKLLSEFGAKKNNKICVKTIFDGRVDLVKYFYPNNDEYLLHAKFYSALRSKNVESVNNFLKDLKNEQIKNLMEQKITNVNPKLFIFERPPLFFAAESGNLNLVKLLVINYGADINFSFRYGTSLHAAVHSGHLEIMKFLIENGANCNAVDCIGKTVLRFAASMGRLEIVKYSIENNKCDINATTELGWTALYSAVFYGRLEIVKYLIENNICDTNATDEWGGTVLHSAAARGHLEIVEYLIENNDCDINATDKWGETALSYATEYNKLEVVEYLIEKTNSDMNATDKLCCLQ